ncbi:MAG: restriction endonuclease subunit S [Candidatus Acidiferrales bacterium]
MRNGWQTKKLGEICEIERGGSPRPIQDFITSDPKGINWIKIGDATASDKYIYKTEEKIKLEGVKRSRMVYEGDFILSNSMSFGRPYIMKTTGCIHDGWLVLRQPKVDPNYLYHVLSSDLVFTQFDRLAAGSTVRNLNIGLARSVEIPYPPLPEQRRIVGILDEAFDGIATAKANAEKNLQNARALFESRLGAAISKCGQMRAIAIAEVAEVFDGPHATPKTVDAGPLFLGISALQDGTVNLGETRHVTRDDFRKWTRRVRPQPNDVVFSYETRLGQAAIIPEGLECCLGRRMGLVRLDPKQVDPRFFVYQYISPPFRQVLSGRTVRGATVDRISIKEFPSFEIALPELGEQQRIADLLDAVREQTRRLESIYKQKLAALDALKKSLLHEAFNGRL